MGGNISLKVSFWKVFKTKCCSDYLKCYDFKFCEDKIRTYLTLINYSKGVDVTVFRNPNLTEWKVDDVETLTPDFFFFYENASSQEPLTECGCSQKANIDGSGRISDDATPNTFNPFVGEFGS
jgi:hypothetical protein